MPASKIAEAYVQIVPRIEGMQASLKKQLDKEVDPALASAGDKGGKAFTSGFGGSLKGIAAVAGGAIAAIGVGQFVKGGVDAAENLNIKLREVVTLTGQTGDQADATFTDFAGLVKNLSGEFGIAQETLTSGLYNALSAGVPKDNALEFMQVASQAAIGGVTDVNTAVDGLTTVINAFGLESSDVSAVADSLFTAVKGGKTTFGELSDSLFNVGPAAAAAGVSFEEVNAAIATLTAGGTPTSVATTQIRAALVGLQRPSEDLDAIFQALGYQNAQLAIESEGLQFALDAVKEASGGSNGELQQLLGSTEAVAAANVLAGTGSEKFTAELEAQNTALGATAAAFEEVDKSRNSERLRIAMENLGIAVGTMLMPMIENLASFLSETLIPAFENGIIPAFENAFAFIKDNIPTIATFIGVLGGLLAIINAARIATAIWTGVQTVFNAVMALNPLVLVAIAVAALAAGIVYLATQTTFFQDTWETVTTFVSEQWAAFGELFAAIGTAIGDFFGTIVENLSLAWDETVEGIKQLWESFGEIFNNVVQGISDFFGTVAETLGSIWDGVVQGFEDAINFFSGIFQTVFEGIGDIFKNIVNGYINLFEMFINFVIDGVNGLIRTLNRIRIEIPATAFSNAFSIGLNIPTLNKLSIPRLAEGGFVDQPTTALIGEAGPEVVMPLDRFESIMGVSERSGSTINYYAAPNQSIDSEQALFQAMRRAKVVANW